MKILIIEDEIIIAQDIKNILESNNYQVCGIVDNYMDAKEYFHAECPDIVISDIYIKGDKNGIELAREIIELKHTPIIFITAYSSDEINNLLSEFNNIHYITKPFTDSQILACIGMVSAKLTHIKCNFKLSKREEEIFHLLIQGKTTAEISSILNIGFETVKTHKKNIYLKYGVCSSTKLISKYLSLEKL